VCFYSSDIYPANYLLAITAPNEWPQWLRRFEQFRLASGLSEEKNEAKQISTLSYHNRRKTEV